MLISLPPLITDALTRVKVTNKRGQARYPIKAVNVLMCQGKSMHDSVSVEGYAVNCAPASKGMDTHVPFIIIVILPRCCRALLYCPFLTHHTAMPRTITNAKIACLDFNLNKHRMSHGVSVVVSNPDEIAAIRKRCDCDCNCDCNCDCVLSPLVLVPVAVLAGGCSGADHSCAGSKTLRASG